MGLGDFTSDESGSKEYVRITREEFEDFLSEHYGWENLSVSGEYAKFNRELVYQIKGIGNEDLQLRVYSSVDKRTDKARDKGSDAIRTIIWSLELDRPIGGRTRTHRIHTWRKNLKKKIDSLLDEWEDNVHRCGECGNWMVKREGEYGEFLGCSAYPDCDNTRHIDD